MVHSFTKNDLVRYIYKETSIAETLAIDEALDQDCVLKDAYQELLSGYRQLPKAGFNAAPTTIQNILRYSQRTALEAQH